MKALCWRDPSWRDERFYVHHLTPLWPNCTEKENSFLTLPGYCWIHPGDSRLPSDFSQSWARQTPAQKGHQKERRERHVGTHIFWLSSYFFPAALWENVKTKWMTISKWKPSLGSLCKYSRSSYVSSGINRLEVCINGLRDCNNQWLRLIEFKIRSYYQASVKDIWSIKLWV